MTDTLDAHAFASACEAAPGVDPEAIRRAVDAYLADLHLSVRRIAKGLTLTPAEAEETFRLRAVEIE